jgi:hypothetical protein
MLDRLARRTFHEMSRGDLHMRAIAGFVVLLGCLVAAAPAAQAKLRFTRDDGSVISFSAKPRVWCGPWEPDVKTPSVHVAVRGRKHHWDLAAVRADVRAGTRVSFPTDFVSAKPRGAQLFAADAPNEASTNEEEASGSMTFTHVTCRHGGVFSFTIEAVLGSELSDLGSIHVAGSFRGHVASAPRRGVASAPRRGAFARG